MTIVEERIAELERRVAVLEAREVMSPYRASAREIAQIGKMGNMAFS